MPKKKPATPKQITLNSEQSLVVGAGDGYYKVLAGPGSGKSECLVQRYVRLVKSGVQPEDILSLTFTKAAADAMRSRAEAAAGTQETNRVSGWLTFHSLALKFAELERDHFPFKLADFPLATEPIAMKISSDAARRFEIDPRRLRSWISLQKRNRVRPGQALKEAEKEGRDEKMALAYKAYDAKLRENGVLDFDSLLLEMVELLSNEPKGIVLSERLNLPKRWFYRFIQTDEAQDNDSIQWELLRLLSRRDKNLLAVGDAGQNLYSFRGSSAGLFMDMGRLFDEPSILAGARTVQTLYLAKNHRSSGQIVALCRACGPVPELAEKFHTDNEDGVAPTVTGFPSSVDEAKAIALAVKSIPPGAMVSVLARTNRALRPIEDIFSVEGIRYHLQGKSGFWSQSEVKALLAYSQCCIYPSDAAVLGALRAPFHPSRYIKKTQVAEDIKKRHESQNVIQFLHHHSEEKVRDFVHFLDSLRRYRDLPATQALKSVISALHADTYYKEEESTPDNSPLENLQELQKVAARFSSLKEFLDFARRASAASKGKKGVCLSTVHSAKGLEWDSVYFVALNDGVLPHAKAESLDDERHVFFVGISRAKTLLHMSYAGPPSQFLERYLKVDVVSEEVFA